MESKNAMNIHGAFGYEVLPKELKRGDLNAYFSLAMALWPISVR